MSPLNSSEIAGASLVKIDFTPVVVNISIAPLFLRCKKNRLNEPLGFLWSAQTRAGMERTIEERSRGDFPFPLRNETTIY